MVSPQAQSPPLSSLSTNATIAYPMANGGGDLSAFHGKLSHPASHSLSLEAPSCSITFCQMLFFVQWLLLLPVSTTTSYRNRRIMLLLSQTIWIPRWCLSHLHECSSLSFSLLQPLYVQAFCFTYLPVSSLTFVVFIHLGSHSLSAVCGCVYFCVQAILKFFSFFCVRCNASFLPPPLYVTFKQGVCNV